MRFKDIVAVEFEQDYYKKLHSYVENEYLHKTIFPPRQNIFRALNLCDYEDVKVVILGQDPYHELHQANGLAFSVYPGVKIPPSLVNIYKEDVYKRQVLNDEVAKIIDDYDFGGVILFANNVKETEQTLKLTNDLQEAAISNKAGNGNLPLLITIDQEGGIVYRLGSGTALPGNMALGCLLYTSTFFIFWKYS